MVAVSRVSVALFVGAAVLAGVGATPAVGTHLGDSSVDRTPPLQPNVTGLEADSRDVQIAVRSDGTAVWEIEYRVALESETATERFETVEGRVDREPLAYAGPFAELMRDVAATAESETGRDMAVRNVSVRAQRLPTGAGVLLYRFEWTNFAATPGNRIEVGDALFGFDVEDDDSTLFVRWPAGFQAQRVTPSPDERRDRTVVWHGPVTFGPGEPRVVVAGGWLRTLPRGPAALVAAVVLVGVAGLVRRRVGSPLSQSRTATTGETATTDGPATTGETTTTDGPATTGETATTDGPATTGETATTDGPATTGETATEGPGDAEGAETGESAVPAELLSDEERVLNLLEANGGRLKQQDIVGELGWSETKTSQVVNGLKDGEKVEVYRIGRENVVALPGEMDV